MLATWWLKKMKRESEEKQAAARREGFREGLEEVRQERIQTRREEGRRQGIREGRLAERQRWEVWARHVEAEFRAAGLPFIEPPPLEDE